MILFHDRVTVKNAAGVALVILGTVIVNSGDGADGKKDPGKEEDGNA